MTRSPVNFREGRRASDGLVAQGIIAFQQKLYEKEKAAGIVQLHQVRQEAMDLLSQFPDKRQQTPDDAPASTLQKLSHKLSVSKRISVPENFAYFPPAKHLALQQQLLQHRLIQKRQSLQKQRFSHGEPLTGMRRVSYVKPYLPTDGLQLPHQGSDFFFQPIAEDESQAEPLEYSRKPLTHSLSYQPTYPAAVAPSASYLGMAPGFSVTSYQPDQPSYQPDQPSYPPDQPSYLPDQPGYQPDQPSYQPVYTLQPTSSTCIAPPTPCSPLHHNYLEGQHSVPAYPSHHDVSLDGLPREMENICKLTDSPRGSPAL